MTMMACPECSPKSSTKLERAVALLVETLNFVGCASKDVGHCGCRVHADGFVEGFCSPVCADEDCDHAWCCDSEELASTTTVADFAEAIRNVLSDRVTSDTGSRLMARLDGLLGRSVPVANNS
jgi:class 3 adenylate cyclase